MVDAMLRWDATFLVILCFPSARDELSGSQNSLLFATWLPRAECDDESMCRFRIDVCSVDLTLPTKLVLPDEFDASKLQ